MKRMWSRNELKNIANEQIQEQVSSGQLKNVKVFENIVDKDGHKRFIEGNITFETIEGITQTYGKWSLSGSHLLIVVGGSAVEGTTIASATKLCDINLPQWIKDKISILYGNSIVLINNVSLFGDAGTSQSTYARIRKLNNVVFIDFSGNLTLSADRNFRFNFDLLIDDE